jgi:type III pantothenate kinase
VTVLLVDIGNTRIKWARLNGDRVGRLHAAAHSGWGAEDFARRLIASVKGLERIVVASVAGAKVDKVLATAAERAGAPKPEFVASRRRAAGVTVGYIEPWRLGVDRFVGVIGAHHLFDHRAVCVVGVGTALTIDLVDADGTHRGGAIIPAPGLMVESLLKHTNGIRRRARGGGAGGAGLFARSTRAAIGQGALYAAAATIDRAVAEARSVVGRAPQVVLTGGGARVVQPLMRCASVSVPDLVLRGLAMLCSEPGRPSRAG